MPFKGAKLRLGGIPLLPLWQKARKCPNGKKKENRMASKFPQQHGSTISNSRKHNGCIKLSNKCGKIQGIEAPMDGGTP